MAKLEQAAAGQAAAQQRAPMIVIAKLWERTSPKGFKFFSGPVGSISKGVKGFQSITLTANDLGLRNGDQVAIMPNTKRTGKKDADYQLVLMSPAS